MKEKKQKKSTEKQTENTKKRTGEEGRIGGITERNGERGSGGGRKNETEKYNGTSYLDNFAFPVPRNMTELWVTRHKKGSV